METLSRTVYAAQVHLAGEVDTQGMAARRGCSIRTGLTPIKGQLADHGVEVVRRPSTPCQPVAQR